MAEIVDGRCHAKKAPESPPLIQHGDLVFQTHHVGWIITGTFTMISIVASFWLINKHLQWYTNKREQRYIVRILFMVPIYSVVSFASYLFWNHSTPLLLLRDGYESTVLTAFFYLLLMYLSPDPEEQKAIFRKNGLSRENDRAARRKGQKVRKWMFPLGPIKSKPADGLYFLQMMKWGVLQYCVIRPTTTLAAVTLDYMGLYCEDSWSPRWGHLYITVIVSISVSISMYCLLQLYMPVSKYLKVHKPILKLFAIKAVVFLTFWQATFLSFLTMFGVVKDTEFMTADNINIGLGAILETFEMTIFAFLHIRAFTYRPYKIPPDRTPRFRSLVHAMNFAETFRELWGGTVYMYHRFRGRETDKQARRDAALENVFGRSRYDIVNKQQQEKRPEYDEKTQKSVAVSIGVDEMVHVGEERQWLGAGDDYAYGLKYQIKKEKSESLGVQIERELQSRGYFRRERSGSAQYEPIGNLDLDPVPRNTTRHSRGQQSWWRKAFTRASQYDDHGPSPGVVDSVAPRVTHRTSRQNSSHRISEQLPHSIPEQQDFEDPPPPSVIRTYRGTRDRRSVVDQFPVPPPVEHVVSQAFIRQATSPESEPRPLPPSSPPRNLKRKPPPQLTPMPMSNLTTYPLLSSTAITPSQSQSDYADSLLNRVFPVSDASHSIEALRSGPTSTQSHHSGVRLGGTGVVNVTGTVVAQAPVVVRPGSSHMNSQERIVEVPGQLVPAISPSLDSSTTIVAPNIPPQYQEPGPSRLPRAAGVQEAQPELRRSSRVPTSRTSYPLDPHAARRDRVVLPAPLAPVATSSVSPPRNRDQPFQYTSSPVSISPPSSNAFPPAHQRGRHSLPSPSSPPHPASFIPAPRPSGSGSMFPPSSPIVTPLSPRSPPPQPALHSPRSPRLPVTATSPPSSPPPLRRGTQNVKRYSYGQGDVSPRERERRRISSPPSHELGAIPASVNSSMNAVPWSALRPVQEDRGERR
ncbi:organic solute transporter Ostalpha-domain-containing protein [Cristinia sonorae]|uniref:Organic solute transporter Ostalpha-domain-containing protein n=1 Tax=Cristinia sonorae TaxID=1940300 RepID=A0A8K0UIK0_9AGAR|nr:organic solute transporter Ostalpha-domain-containing protein [Cristinia sonorae]